MKTSRGTWYITLIAIYYFVVCTITSIVYIVQNFRPGPMMIPWTTQLLCFGAAISAGIYLANPHLGHRCLIAVTLLTLFAIGETDIHATRFHLTILAVLLLPLLFKGKRDAVEDHPMSLLGEPA